MLSAFWSHSCNVCGGWLKIQGGGGCVTPSIGCGTYFVRFVDCACSALNDDGHVEMHCCLHRWLVAAGSLVPWLYFDGSYLYPLGFHCSERTHILFYHSDSNTISVDRSIALWFGICFHQHIHPYWWKTFQSSCSWSTVFYEMLLITIHDEGRCVSPLINYLTIFNLRIKLKQLLPRIKSIKSFE